MLLLHQTDSLKIGEVVRYTVTYTPSADRILPSPEFLFLRIKNTCAIALRAAFVHGPYNLNVAAYPSNYNPNETFENPRRYGVPEFEPMLKAGAVWNCHLVVPDNIRQSAGEGSSQHGHFGKGPDADSESVTWIIEVASQVIFSSSAAVHYEILLARDEKSLNLGSVIPVIGGKAQVPTPGRVSDFQKCAFCAGCGEGSESTQPKGVFSRAIRVKVEDTASLWDTPKLPCCENFSRGAHCHGVHSQVGLADSESRTGDAKPPPPVKQKKIHLVVLTHGLHSNLGADMLFLKESIDAGVRKAKRDARERRARERAKRSAEAGSGTSQGNETPERDDGTVVDVEEDPDDDEEIVVRGFSGNATKTERGIKYLGKRLANFVLSMTYPDQPCLPIGKAAAQAVTRPLKVGLQKSEGEEKNPQSRGAGREVQSTEIRRLHKITKISFIAHSLGGLVQMYAIAYIQKHSPTFFDLIEPINFITMASPLLGLNHENPLYVKFALDFGLVGRTGQDLGLTWRAPTIARSGWGAIVGNLGENAHRHVYGDSQPESKPLLRILPTGPAHKALKKFRNRTVYSNVVNDGIVPLRTSCLLFLDWQGLGRVDKARREAGLVETVVGFGWAELTGANVTTPRIGPWLPEESNVKETPSSSGDSTPSAVTGSHEVPQPPTNATLEDDRQSMRSVPFMEGGSTDPQRLQTSTTSNGRLSGIFNFFRSERSQTPPPPGPKQLRIYQRSQTIKIGSSDDQGSEASSRSRVTSGIELEEGEGVLAPPRTTIFESAGDLLRPKLPTMEYLLDPSKRPRAIFHDRVYHPPDIPPPPMKRPTPPSLSLRSRKSTARSPAPSPPRKTHSDDSSLAIPLVASPQIDPSISRRGESDLSRLSGLSRSSGDQEPDEIVDSSQMKVEEKIARAYHKELSWRKVLVKIEPDAHNNIIVRRMFANAFGWPVVNHLVEAHFSDSAVARMADEDEAGRERAKKLSEPPDKHGTETRKKAHATDGPSSDKSEEETRGGRGLEKKDTNMEAEARDAVPDLPQQQTRLESIENPLGLFPTSPTARILTRPPIDRADSMTWSERDWLDSGDDSGDEAAAGQPRSSADRIRNSLEKGKGPEKWNWTEKIVGKGAVSKSKSPRTGTPDQAEMPSLPVLSHDGPGDAKVEGHDAPAAAMDPGPAGAKAGDAAPETAAAPVVDIIAKNSQVDDAKPKGADAVDPTAIDRK